MDNSFIFHNEISLPLEEDAKELLSEVIEPNDWNGTVFHPDNIDAGCSVAAMILLLLIKRKFEVDKEVMTFMSSCRDYLGKGRRDIPDEISKELFDQYRALYRKQEGIS